MRNLGKLFLSYLLLLAQTEVSTRQTRACADGPFIYFHEEVSWIPYHYISMPKSPAESDSTECKELESCLPTL